MTAVDQLDWVEYYLSNNGKGKMKTVYDVYLAVFAPAYLGKPDSQILYKSPTVQYAANVGMDKNRDGCITVGDVKAIIGKHVPKAPAPLAVTGQPDLLIPVLVIGGITAAVVFRGELGRFFDSFTTPEPTYPVSYYPNANSHERA